MILENEDFKKITINLEIAKVKIVAIIKNLLRNLINLNVVNGKAIESAKMIKTATKIAPIQMLSVVSRDPIEPPREISPPKVKYPKIPFQGSKNPSIPVDAIKITKLLMTIFTCLIKNVGRLIDIVSNEIIHPRYRKVESPKGFKNDFLAIK